MTEAAEHFDVAIVGAGVAGAIMAAQLAAAKKRVVLLEAGSEGPGRAELVKAYAEAAIKGTRSPYTDCGPDSPVQSPEGESDYEQAGKFAFKSGYLRRMGGSTWHMLGNMPRHLPSDFKLRSRYGKGVDWPITYNDLESWYCRAERELGVSGDHEELNGLHGAYRSEPFPMTKVWSSYGDMLIRDAIRGLEVEGRPVTLMCTPQARNSRPYDGRPACAGNSSCVPICPIGAKYDASVHVRKAGEHKADIRQRCVASKLMIDPATNRVSSLEYIDWSDYPNVRRLPLSADFYVIAAHAIETPRLLLMSAGTSAPNGVANESGEVGRNLMDHLQGQVACLTKESLFPFRGPPTTSGVDVFRDGEFRSQYAAFRMSIGNDGMGRTETPPQTLRNLLKGGLLGTELRDALRARTSRHFRISYSTEQLPSKSNTVTLSRTKCDEFCLPMPVLSVDLDDYNRRAFDAAQAVIAKIFDRLGGTERKGPSDANSYSGAGHIIGTTRMGSDPNCSVVDADCKAHQHDNLYIVGASVFPTAGTANPTLTVAALALRAADHISKLFGTGGFR